jgi:uncharacterized protein YndB with AHSA1/START domain
MRGSVRHHVRIARPGGEVWDVVGRPELLHHWFPGIVDCTVDGRRREITTGTGGTMVEELLTNDPIQRRFQYRLTGGLFTDHLATIDVIDLGDGTSIVLYAQDVEPASLAIVLGGGAAGALDELRRQVEAGAGPAVDAARAADGPPLPLAPEGPR